MTRRALGGVFALCCLLLLAVAPANALAKKKPKEPMLAATSYPGMTTFQCRTDAIAIHPGQNINDFKVTKTCPNAVKISGDLDASIFNPGSQAEGYITRFKPSMVEVHPDGTLTTPSVWDLHLHHVVWLRRGLGPTFASGEEKTIAVQPQGYGLKVGATENWGINQMIHNLNATDGRSVYITWEIDWVPETTPARTDIKEVEVQWLDVAGSPQIYPVFDAEKGFDLDGDGKWTFPDDVPTDPSQPGYEERGKISEARQWIVPNTGATLVFGAGHLHPGGKRVDLKVARDGPDPGTEPGDSEGEVKRLFRSDARYYEPAGAVSWDVAMEATPREWRISLKPGDKVYVSTTYDVRRASWYESMGIMPLSWTTEPDPAARDPWDNPDEVKAMYKMPGVLTHRRLKENIDFKARQDLGLPDPRTLKAAGPVPQAGIPIRSFYFTSGGYSAVSGFPAEQMRPPTIKSGESVTFINEDAVFGTSNEDQAWHSITSCRAPCTKDSGIGYPLANGPIKFDSGQIGYGTGTSAGVTTQTDTWSTPPLTTTPGDKQGTTYTYFCRIHPYMRGSVRVKK